MFILHILDKKLPSLKNITKNIIIHKIRKVHKHRGWQQLQYLNTKKQ